jgi:hypothetical protein
MEEEYQTFLKQFGLKKDEPAEGKEPKREERRPR